MRALADIGQSSRSRSDLIKVSNGVMLSRIEVLGDRGQVSSIEYHVSSRNSGGRWVFDNQPDADWRFYEALKTARLAVVG